MINPLIHKKTLLQRYLNDHKKVVVIIIVLITLWGAFSLWRMYEGTDFYTLTLSGFFVLFLSLILIFIHIHYRFLQIQTQQNNNYRQQQSLQSIYGLIDIRSPLPTMGAWAASPDFIQIISEIILEKKPKTVVECGSGVSSVVIGYLLEKNERGRLFSLENSDVFFEKSKQLIAQHQLDSQVDILHAPLISMKLNKADVKWYDTTQVADIQQIDILIIDGPTGHRYPVLPMLFEQLSDTVIIIIDDCKREKDSGNISRWLSEFPLTATWVDTEKGTCILKKT